MLDRDEHDTERAASGAVFPVELRLEQRRRVHGEPARSALVKEVLCLIGAHQHPDDAAREHGIEVAEPRTGDRAEHRVLGGEPRRLHLGRGVGARSAEIAVRLRRRSASGEQHGASGDEQDSTDEERGAAQEETPERMRGVYPGWPRD